MKKLTIFAVLVLLLAAAISVRAGGPWAVKAEGNGAVNGGDLPSYGVDQADIGWNLKMNFDYEVQGQLNIVEKLSNGGTRHFRLSGDQVFPVGDPAVRPILFNCAVGGLDGRSVRVEGVDGNGNLISIHVRDSQHPDYPNSAWYWVQDPSGTYITNTNTRLSLSDPFTLFCG